MKFKMLLILVCALLPQVDAAVLNVPGSYPTIQSAVAAAVNSDTVLLAPGTYTGSGNTDTSFCGKNIVIQSDGSAADCVIDGGGLHRGFIFENSENSSARLAHLTVRNCFGTTLTPFPIGAAVYCGQGTRPVIDHCIFEANVADYGGAVGCEGSYPLITGCRFLRNQSGQGGGAVVIYGARVEISSCTFEGNESKYGGAVYAWDYATCYVKNCLFTGNTASADGGGTCVDFESGLFAVNCTYQGNLAYHGGGAAVRPFSNCILISCILWENTAPNGSQAAAVSDGFESDVTMTIRACDIQDGHSGTYCDPEASLFFDPGWINSDPLFVSGPNGDFYLSQVAAGQPADSPCVDSGYHIEAGYACMTTAAGPVCLDYFTTSTNEAPDWDRSDMGYHYDTGLTVPTATPLPPTCPPHPTFTPDYHGTPTDTPTPNPPATETPDITATATPVMQDETRVEIDLSHSMFHFNDLFACNGRVFVGAGEYPSGISDAQFCSVLDVNGVFFILTPGEYTQTPVEQWPGQTYPAGITPVQIIPEFIWPAVTDPGLPCRIYAALIDMNELILITPAVVVEFSWE